MLCGISGQPAEKAVISKKNGQVYEERLILAYLAENGKDPISGEDLSEEDLVSIKQNPGAAISKPPELNSIPAILTGLQNEYDALMLELSSVRRAYDNIRQELAHALYANDSAHRVIVRLINERDEARLALTSIKGSLGQNGTSNGKSKETAAEAIDATMSEVAPTAREAPAIPSSSGSTFVEIINAAHEQLSSTRKAKMKRKPSSYLTQAIVKSKKLKQSPVKFGDDILCADSTLDGSSWIVGRSDGAVLITRDGESIEIGRHDHGRVGKIVFAQNIVNAEHGNVSSIASPTAAASISGNVLIIWHAGEDGTFKEAHRIVNGDEDVFFDLVSHPTGKFIIVTTTDWIDGTGDTTRSEWALYDVETGAKLMHAIIPTHALEAKSLGIHPDGILIGIGTYDGEVFIYDLRNGEQSARFEMENSSDINSISFSENGYYLATAGDHQCEVYDLRKMQKIHSIITGEPKCEGSWMIARFDPSGQLLACSDTENSFIFASKSWEKLASFEGQTSEYFWSWKDGKLFALRDDAVESITFE